MKVEMKLVYNNMKKNIKRMIFTTISIILCTFLILTTMLVVSSIRNGITDNIANENNDYSFIIKEIDMDSFNKIKNKEYIDKIYIKESETKLLKEVEKPYDSFKIDNNVNIYIKYNNIKETCEYSTDIIKTLDLSYNDAISKCEFNEKLLTVNGLIDIEIKNVNDYTIICQTRVNYSYVLDIMLVVILLAFSILFIIILYNAFLITINERKREYAILNSVGCTENQILKMVFLEAIIMGIIGIIIGGLISVLGANIIIKIINNILALTTYNFRLIFDIKYIIISIVIIIFNIYIASIIPSVKASNISIIQDIRNNKQIKYSKRNTILEKILPVEGKIALKNIKRNKNKYRVISVLLVICMTLYIVVSTYIRYEKEVADLVNEHDVDAELIFNSNLNEDYKSILDNYETESGSEIEYMEYKKFGPFILVEPENAVITEQLVTQYEDNKKSINMLVIGLDNKTYNKYINKLNAKSGDIIIYNNITLHEGTKEIVYKYYPALQKDDELKLSLVAIFYNDEKNISKYEVIDDKNLNGNFILTDELIEGYKDVKNMPYGIPTIFLNMDTYNKVAEKFDNYTQKNKNSAQKWLWNDDTDEICVKVKCDNIIGFSNYIKEVNEKQNIEVYAEYYTLENQEKIIYINIIQFLLRIIILIVMIIGSISTINIINASLCERKEEFKILNRVGATRGNINKVLIYECVYVFIKSAIKSIIFALPILYIIIKYMENLIVLNTILIPFQDIYLFFILLFIISLSITLYSAKIIKID